MISLRSLSLATRVSSTGAPLLKSSEVSLLFSTQHSFSTGALPMVIAGSSLEEAQRERRFSVPFRAREVVTLLCCIQSVLTS